MNDKNSILKNMSPKAFAGMLREHGMELPVEESMESLRKPVNILDKTIPNRICIQPLEGYDSCDDGSPSEMVYRRYRRFANSGAGLVWFESAAVADDGKSNPHQMMLSGSRLPEFGSLIEEMDKISLEKFGYKQYKILQLTHSGRVSRGNDWARRPLAARLLDTDADSSILASDERIYKLIEEMTEHAVMAKEAGFDAVDVKACHGYFLSELLSAYERKGVFGGSFENRTKAILKIIDGIRERTGGGFGLAVRLNAYDSVPVPHGWCLREEGGMLAPDLTEAVKLCGILKDKGTGIIDISASQPGQSLYGGMPDETVKPYSGAYDMLMAVKDIKSRVSGVQFVCTGLSQFKQFGPAIGAGGISEGWFDLAGFGRQALAYPESVTEALNGKTPDADKCCVLCGSCFRLMDPGLSATGCVVRDPDPYAGFYRRD